MACCNFPDFRLHPGRTEQNGHGASFPNGVDQGPGAVRVIAGNHDGLEHKARHCVGDGFLFSKEPRLQTTKLNHETRQRCDDFFAGENQHITQRRQPKSGYVVTPGKSWTSPILWRPGRVSLRYFRNKCPLSANM